jgi:hypothetical protein
MSKTLYRVEFGVQMGLCRGECAQDVEDYMLRVIGTERGYNMRVEQADEDDEAWFKQMGGGYVYEAPSRRDEDEE